MLFCVKDFLKAPGVAIGGECMTTKTNMKIFLKMKIIIFLYAALPNLFWNVIHESFHHLMFLFHTISLDADIDTKEILKRFIYPFH